MEIVESSESDCELTPSNIVETSLTLIPEVSKKKYTVSYELFKDWQRKNKSESISENILLTYFNELSAKFKASTLWAQYSMLRTTININNNIDIGNYPKLRAFLKGKSNGYRPRKSNVFSSEEIHKFLKEAPDSEYLLAKVVLIMGTMGACRRDQLYNMKITNIQDLGSAVLIEVPNTKRKIARQFTITGYFYNIFKKYANLRPKHVNDTSFFLNYQKGKCTGQKVGINKLGYMGKQIALFLKLPNPELYTGHCFRRSSGTILVDNGKDKTSLKRDDGWKSLAVVESNIDDSLENKYDIVSKLFESIESGANPSSTSRMENTDKTNNIMMCKDSPKIVFNNCTFNISK